MSGNIKLYEAAEQLEIVRGWMNEFEEEIIAGGGVIPDALAELLEKAEGDLTTKVERVALVQQELKHSAEAAKSEATRLLALASARTRAADVLRNYLLGTLLGLRVKKVDAPRVKVAVQRNGQASIGAPDQATLYGMIVENNARRERDLPVVSSDPTETPVERYLTLRLLPTVELERGKVMEDFNAAYDAEAALCPAKMDEFEKHERCMEAGRRVLPSWITIDRGYHIRFR